MKIQTIRINPSSPRIEGKYPSDAAVVVLCDAADASFAVHMPTAKATPKLILLKKVDTTGNAVDIIFRPGETGDGQSAVSITAPYACVGYVNDGANYHRVI